MGDRIGYKSHIIPRAGELIEAAEYLKQDDVAFFLVQSVIYKMEKGGFAAYITAKQWYKGIRSTFLTERGWLAPVQGNLVDGFSYDEDDPAAMLEPVASVGKSRLRKRGPRRS